MSDADPREAEVWDRLSAVVDPELDESVTELKFVTGVRVAEDGRVRVGFRLPTYWCAANFAFLMADDMRRAVLALPWATGVDVELDEHMYADAINRGIASGRSFRATFGGEAREEDVEDVRRVFLVKAFQRRQETLLRRLLKSGRAPADVLALSVARLRELALDPEDERLVRRYLERRDAVGPARADDPAFVDERGAAIPPEGLRTHLRRLRGVAVNVEFNGALCRGLLAARYGEAGATPLPTDREPELIDFLRASPRERPTVRS